MLPTAHELGIGFVAFSPLGRGFLAGSVRSRDDLALNDFRRMLPRFEQGSLTRNAALADRFSALADEWGTTPAGLALAWLLHKGVVPIPGTRRSHHLTANLAATELTLTPDQWKRVENVFAHVAGSRYPDMRRALAAKGGTPDD